MLQNSMTYASTCEFAGPSSNPKTLFAEQRFTSNDDFKPETIGYFVDLDKAHYTGGFKK